MATEPVDKPACPDRILPEGREGFAGAGARAGDDRCSYGLRAIGAAALVAVFVLSFAFPPAGLGRSTCAFRNALGIPCPGCGLTRSFAALSHGLPGLAFRMHPLGPFIYAGFVFYMVKWALEAAFRRRLLPRAEDRLRVPVLWGLVIAMTCTWLCRLITATSF